MKMITEANLDDKFNKHLQKVQDGVQELMKLTDEFKKQSIRPVSTQVTALAFAAEDIAQLAKRLKELRG